MEQRVQAVPQVGKTDAFYRMFKALTSDADLEYAMIDGTIVKVHRSGQGA